MGERDSIDRVVGRLTAREGVVFIIDYDVPKSPASENRAFYRALSKLKRTYGYDGKSTASVLKTTDRQLAFKIRDLAVSFGGEAHVYQAREIGETNRSDVENAEFPGA